MYVIKSIKKKKKRKKILTKSSRIKKIFDQILLKKIKMELVGIF